MLMATGVFIFGVAAVLLLAASWAVLRTRRIRAASRARETKALAAMASRDAADSDGETLFAGLRSQQSLSGGIEVAEVVDLDALLGGLPKGDADRARARLEGPTDFSVGAIETYPAAPARTPLLPPGSGSLPTAPARPAPASVTTARVGSPSGAAAGWPVTPATLPAASSGRPPRVGDDVPLRELALAWFEARGYRSAPASAAVRPIEVVLRHKASPARAYAVVVETQRVTAERVQALRIQAREIGLMRLLVVAAAGAEPRAAEGMKGVRVMDRSALDGEFSQLDLAVAAKIIAVARKRSGVVAAPR